MYFPMKTGQITKYFSLLPPLAIGYILTLGLASCTPIQQAGTQANPNTPLANSPASIPSTTSKNLPKIVVTHSVLCDITKEIAQATIDLTCLITPGTDPHEYQAKPEDKKAIEQAKLVLYGGYGFEPGLIKMIQSSQTPTPKVAVSEVAVPQPLKVAADHESETASKAPEKALEKSATHDHDHGESDPHIWHNAQNGVKMVQVIRDQLKAISPENAGLYTDNAEKLSQQLQAVDTWIKTQVGTIPPEQKQLITTHESMGYFAATYGIKLEGALQGITTEEQPTATRITALVQEIKSTKVPTIFPEANINPGLMKVVAKEARVKVAETPIFGDGLGEKGTEADTYIKMLTTNTCTIVNGLGGKCTPFIIK